MRLYIIRHAAAEQGNYDRDFHRVLRKKGHNQLPKMTRFLLKHQSANVDIHVSSSDRTRETFEGIQFAFNGVNPTFHEELYHASLQTLLDFIWGLNTENKDIAIIGHNPGLSALSAYFTEKEGYLSTGGIVIVEFPFHKTVELSKGCGEIVEKFRWS